MLQRRDLLAAVIGLAVAVAVVLLLRDPGSTPTPGPAPKKDPPAPVAPTAPTPAPGPTGPTPPPAPGPADPTGPGGELLQDDPVADAQVHAAWQERLALEDEEVVKQVAAAGCDAARLEKVRALLAKKRSERAETIEEYRAGRISMDEMRARARDTRRRTEAALAEVLTAEELAAIDLDGARAAVIETEKRD